MKEIYFSCPSQLDEAAAEKHAGKEPEMMNSPTWECDDRALWETMRDSYLAGCAHKDAQVAGLVERLEETNKCIVDDDDRLAISRRLNEKALEKWRGK
jgi:arylsulfatase A-like enzyme